MVGLRKRGKGMIKLLMLIIVLTTIGMIAGCNNQPAIDTQDVTAHLEWNDKTQLWNGTVEFQESQINGFSNEISVEVSNIVGDEDATANAIKQALGLE